MKRLLPVFLLVSALGFAQGGARDGSLIKSTAGQAGTVRVCTSAATGTPCAPLASVYSDAALTVPLTNPVATDANGNYWYYALPGNYKEQITVGSSTVTLAVGIPDTVTAVHTTGTENVAGAKTFSNRVTVQTADSNGFLLKPTADVDGFTITPNADGQTTRAFGLTNAANNSWIAYILKNGSATFKATTVDSLSTAGQFTSTLATGTAPLVIASTTKVSNLNVDQLDGKDWAIPAAIGSTTPAAITGTTVAANTSLTVGSGTAITKHLSATATLDFAAITAPNCASDLTVTVTGAAVGDSVELGVPNGAIAAGVQFFAWVSSTNTVSVRACAFTGTPNPASGTFRVDVWQH